MLMSAAPSRNFALAGYSSSASSPMPHCRTSTPQPCMNWLDNQRVIVLASVKIDADLNLLHVPPPGQPFSSHSLSLTSRYTHADRPVPRKFVGISQRMPHPFKVDFIGMAKRPLPCGEEASVRMKVFSEWNYFHVRKNASTAHGFVLPDATPTESNSYQPKTEERNKGSQEIKEQTIASKELTNHPIIPRPSTRRTTSAPR